MFNMKVVVLLEVINLLILYYEPVSADGGASAIAAAAVDIDHGYHGHPRHPEDHYGHPDYDEPSLPPVYPHHPGEEGMMPYHPPVPMYDDVDLLKQSVANENAAHSYLYDQEDVEAFLHDGYTVMSYMNQRSGNWERAYQLAVKTLRWRAEMGLNQLDASYFPCNLFRLGLIFESGATHYRSDMGEYVDGHPVIWIRLGAFGSVIKYLEKLTPKRIVSYAINAAKSGVSHTVSLASKLFRKNQQPKVRAAKPSQVEDLSLRNERTIMHVLKSIAWWLNDWQASHPPGTKATLVLDFEGTDSAFTSSSIGDFFVKLDDHFPDLFDQILGFRYKNKPLSIHSSISMINKLFKARISSSPESDKKLKFVATEAKLSTYMPRVDVHGYTMLPEHVSGTCVSPDREPPVGCQDDAHALASTGLYDPQLWQAIHNEIYQLCRAKPRTL